MRASVLKRNHFSRPQSYLRDPGGSSGCSRLPSRFLLFFSLPLKRRRVHQQAFVNENDNNLSCVRDPSPLWIGCIDKPSLHSEVLQGVPVRMWSPISSGVSCAMKGSDDVHTCSKGGCQGYLFLVYMQIRSSEDDRFSPSVILAESLFHDTSCTGTFFSVH